MDTEFTSFFIVLSILWFLVYWVLGGVFFAIVTVMRLGRLRKVRFSCLFTILSLLVGVGAAYTGLMGARRAVSECLGDAVTNAEQLTAVFGCGAASIFGMFLLGALVLTAGGFLIMFVSKSKAKPWIVLDLEEEPEPVVASENQEVLPAKSESFEG